MLKILLVDDEDIIKSGLRREVHWEDLGCLIVGEASDGEEALDLIRSDPPDVVISDIRMPFKDGLTLMEEARQIKLDLYFLFISGHDEFSYVQRALKLGATDYILKPIDPIYLGERLQELASEISSRSRDEESLLMTKRIQIRQFFQKIILGSPGENSIIRQEADLLDPKLSSCFFQIISLQIDHYYNYAGSDENGREEEIRKSFFRLADEFPKDNCYRITDSLREYDLCMVGKDLTVMTNLLKEGFRSLQKRTSALNYTVTLGVGDPVSHLENLPRSFTQAKEALEMKYLKGDNRIYTSEEYRNFKARAKGVGTPLDAEALLKAVQEGQACIIPHLIEKLSSDIADKKDSRTLLNWLASDILLQLMKILSQREMSMEEILENPLQEWEIITRSSTAESFLKNLQQVLTSLAEAIHIRSDYHSSQILNQAITYIKENFTEKTLSLDEVAARACMSSCYFAVIFKQESGRTFNRFLTDLRINKAKDLILYTDLKSYEIGPKVGYDNPSYFSTVFKKATGMSPSEYRKTYS
jgi:two-component system response regulator YesN